MYDIDSIDRAIEMFVFDIIVAIEKIRYVTNQFNNPQDLLYDFEEIVILLIDTFIQDNHYLDFVVEKLNSLRSDIWYLIKF